jgi:hypothetical protein
MDGGLFGIVFITHFPKRYCLVFRLFERVLDEVFISNSGSCIVISQISVYLLKFLNPFNEAKFGSHDENHREIDI